MTASICPHSAVVHTARPRDRPKATRLICGGDVNCSGDLEGCMTAMNEAWQSASPDADVDVSAWERVVSDLMSSTTTTGQTLALVAVHRGRIVGEHYGAGHDETSTFISWSMAKSMTHALVGFLVRDGLIDIDAPAAVPEWRDDERSGITFRHLLEMRSGLEWVEDYVDGERSHVIDMLFGSGKADHAAFAAALPLRHPAGTHWEYSSGTTNIICRILGDLVAGGADTGASPAERRGRMEAFINDRLFAPLGMSSATAKFDPAGNFVGSSYVYATAADFARFGRLYVDGASRDGTKILPAETGNGYGHHWWTWPQLPGAVVATGYEGQYTIVLPEDDLVVVRLGKSSAEIRANVVDDLVALVNELRH